MNSEEVSGARPSDQALVNEAPTGLRPTGFDPSRERPSRHGSALGEMLADLAKAGAVGTDLLSAMCATCAFREGCMTNQMAATGLQAMNIVLGVDDSDFCCHYGLKDGQPTRLCAGAVAAKRAPFEVKKAALFTLAARLDTAAGPDETRAAFDEWIARHDPDGQMDDYQRARAFARDSRSKPDRAETGTGSVHESDGAGTAIARKEDP